MFYVIFFEDGTIKYTEGADYTQTLHCAEYCKQFLDYEDYTIEEYDSYEDFISNIKEMKQCKNLYL